MKDFISYAKVYRIFSTVCISTIENTLEYPYDPSVFLNSKIDY